MNVRIYRLHTIAVISVKRRSTSPPHRRLCSNVATRHWQHYPTDVYQRGHSFVVLPSYHFSKSAFSLCVGLSHFKTIPWGVCVCSYKHPMRHKLSYFFKTVKFSFVEVACILFTIFSLCENGSTWLSYKQTQILCHADLYFRVRA